MRNRIPLNTKWVFKKDDQTEIEVDLPHCFNAEDGQTSANMFRGAGKYVVSWKLPQADRDRLYFLEVGAASLVSQVTVNGKACYVSRCGFSMYRVPLTPLIVSGTNKIEIEVSNARSPDVYPAMADFSFYGGLYRDVYIICDERTHFCETDGTREGVLICPSILEDGNGQIEITASIESSLAEVCCEVAVIDASGSVVANTSRTKTIDGIGNFEFTLDIHAPHLWEGIESPYLYNVRASLSVDNELVDERYISTGFRTVAFDPERGLLLNGKPTQLRGVARHQDFGGKGNAITLQDMKTDIDLILEMGANSVRLSHYQHAEEIYALCDQAGLLVWAEIPVITAVSAAVGAEENAREQLRNLILQGRNHCSIYCWGVQNETGIASNNEQAYRFVERLAERAKSLDSTRMTAQANEYGTEDDCPLNNYTDLLGYNLYYGWYYGKMDELQARLDSIHQAHPQKPIILTEYGADTNVTFHSIEPQAGDYSEEYQIRFCQNALDAIEARPWLAGSYAWAMFDFGSSGRSEGGKNGINQKGLVTIDRRIKKDAFYLFKAYWSKKPFVYIAGRRFKERAQATTSITILGKIDRLQLFVNGQCIAEKSNPTPCMVFEKVELIMGENEICVYGWDERGLSYFDAISIMRVSQASPSYVYQAPNMRNSQTVINWFDGLDQATLDHESDAPLQLCDDGFSFDDIIATIFENPNAQAVFLKYFRPLTLDNRFEESKHLFSFNKLIKLSRADIPSSVLRLCEKELNKIKK